MTIPEPKPVRCLLEADIETFFKLANVLSELGGQRAEVPIVFNNQVKEDFRRLAAIITGRISDQSINYEGQRYVIVLAPKKRLFRANDREAVLGIEYGNNFLDACRNFMRFHPWMLRHYNERRNTYAGRTLIEP